MFEEGKIKIRLRDVHIPVANVSSWGKKST